jgi:S-adenosylmethionine hydrolase
MTETARTLTLLTDFGLKDPYVGVMKGVILSINGDLAIVDITHDVEPQDVREAAFLVKEYYQYFERGTIHVAVVDPFVGSDRRAIVVRTEEHLFVGPDNGLFTLVLDGEAEVYSIENQGFMLPGVSATFHGRDIFAPAAAHLSKGFHPSALGPLVTDPVRLAGLLAEAEGGVLRGIVIRFDRFGNAITNIPGRDLEDFVRERKVHITVGDRTFTSLSRSYCEDKFTCLIGSNGYLEFGSFMGNFREETGIRKGELVLATPP